VVVDLSGAPETKSKAAPLIVCDNVVKIYKVANLETVALQGLDLVVARGELLGLVGPSGSGKSTLLNVLGGIDRPSAGRVWVDGQNLLEMPDSELDQYRRSTVGFVWQQGSRNLVPYLDALENVALPLAIAGGRARSERAAALLELVGLADRRHHRLAELSGGEQQRVAIAVAMANEPKLLLADEPTGEVDSATAQVIYDTFRRLNRDFGLTTVIVSHDPVLARYTSRVVAIHDGKTASETVRQMARPRPSVDEARGIEEEEEEVFEELVVLDSAGRLQVPKEQLEQLGIKGRARLEVAEEGILIRPVPEAESAHAADVLSAELAVGAGRRGWRGAEVASRLARGVGESIAGSVSAGRRWISRLWAKISGSRRRSRRRSGDEVETGR
jgi:putative ABC transport system ATP-binding protein